ncbi:hypothetical protein AAX21_00225 [Oenococcus oeni]|nr:hypothetical protein AAX21_00225 [Oenococcus oeni]
MKKKISSRFIYFFGAFGGILFGYDIGVMTGALPFLEKDWNLYNSAGIVGWITSGHVWSHFRRSLGRTIG